MKKHAACLFLALCFLCSLLSACGSNANAYAPGQRSDSSFSSDWLGLRYTLGSDMVMTSDQELYALSDPGGSSIVLDAESGQPRLAYDNLAVVYEMMAFSVNAANNIIIMAEKLSPVSTSEEQYRQSFLCEAQSLYDMSDIVESRRDVCGVDFCDITYAISANGASLQQTTLIKKLGDRMAVVTLTYNDADGLAALLAGFEAL